MRHIKILALFRAIVAPFSEKYKLMIKMNPKFKSFKIRYELELKWIKTINGKPYTKKQGTDFLDENGIIYNKNNKSE